MVVVNYMKAKPGDVVDFGAKMKGKLLIPDEITKVVGKKTKLDVAVVVKVIASKNLVPVTGNNAAAPL